MAVVYNDTLKTNRMQLMSDLVAAKTVVASTGSGGIGKLVIGDGTLNGATNATIGVLATILLPTGTPFTITTPVAGTVVATLNGVPLNNTASATGTASKAELRNPSDVPICTGLTVGTSATDVILGTTSITSGGTVTIVSVSKITHG